MISLLNLIVTPSMKYLFADYSLIGSTEASNDMLDQTSLNIAGEQDGKLDILHVSEANEEKIKKIIGGSTYNKKEIEEYIFCLYRHKIMADLHTDYVSGPTVRVDVTEYFEILHKGGLLDNFLSDLGNTRLDITGAKLDSLASEVYLGMQNMPWFPKFNAYDKMTLSKRDMSNWLMCNHQEFLHRIPISEYNNIDAFIEGDSFVFNIDVSYFFDCLFAYKYKSVEMRNDYQVDLINLALETYKSPEAFITHLLNNTNRSDRPNDGGAYITSRYASIKPTGPVDFIKWFYMEHQPMPSFIAESLETMDCCISEKDILDMLKAF